MLFLFLTAMGLSLAGWRLVPRFRGLERTGEGEGVGEEGAGVVEERLSVIIPARNEAANLPVLLASLRASSLRPGEILVVDDGSDDGTAEVARAGGARVIVPGAPPEGWHGKTWACHRGAGEAAGSLLCFLDADTRLARGGLAAMRAAHRGGALSLCPWHAVERPYEHLSLFFNLNMVAGTAPGGLFGQVLWVDRASYERCGGHEVVRGRILENFRLAEAMRACGVPVRGVCGRGVVDFRMYPDGLAGLVEGWTKGFASGAGNTARGTLLLCVAWMTGLMLVAISPWAAACCGWMTPMSWLAWAGLYAHAAGQVGWMGRQVGNFGVCTALLYPLPLLFFFGLFARSARRSGRAVTWKGRELRGD